MLERIAGPADLATLSYAELDELAAEIRHFIVHAVATHGGHLGSNLGAVELTLALHRVFDSPRDQLLWDTGHQAYVHKILTGRQGGFSALRRAGGLSGYPNRAESDHDLVENSHASTILSYAYGLATARALGQNLVDGDAAAHRHIVAVIGDGSMTGGMAYEALNNLGHSGRRVLIVLNDNGRSYAPTVSKLTEGMVRFRMNPAYVRQRARLERLLHEVPVVGHQLERGLDGARAALREVFEPPHFFETLGVRYVGPIDGHDVEELEHALANAAAYDGPIVVHVLTQKGKGYKPAEDDDEKKGHDSGTFDPEVGPQVVAAAAGYTDAFTASLLSAAEDHPELVAITAAMPGSTGLLPFQAAHPDRCFDVGIAEQHAVCGAAGMAMGGLRPVVAVYATFLTRAIDQVIYDVGLHQQPVIFAIDRAGVTGPDGASHHGVYDMALFAKVPGITMFAPSSYEELQVMFADALRITGGPVSIRWPRTAARRVPADQVGSGLSARKVCDGTDVCLIGVGKMLERAETVAATLAAEGVSVSVWDPRVVMPLDEAMLADASTHRVVVTIEDGIADGGIGSIAVTRIAERCASEGRPVPALRVLGTPSQFMQHGPADDILASLGLDVAGIADSVRALVTAGAALPG